MEILLVQSKTTIRSLLRTGAVFPINGRYREECLNQHWFTSIGEEICAKVGDA